MPLMHLERGILYTDFCLNKDFCLFVSMHTCVYVKERHLREKKDYNRQENVSEGRQERKRLKKRDNDLSKSR